MSVHGPMLNKRCTTLPAVYCRSFASEVGILSDFEDFEFAVPLNRRTKVESNFWTAPAPGRLFPRKSHRSAFKLRGRMAERTIICLNEILLFYQAGPWSMKTQSRRRMGKLSSIILQRHSYQMTSINSLSPSLLKNITRYHEIFM